MRRRVQGLLLCALALSLVAPATVHQQAALAQPATRGITGAVPPRHLGLINSGHKKWRVFNHAPNTPYEAADLNSTNSTENALAHLFIGGLNKHTGKPEGLHYASGPGVERDDERAFVSVIDATAADPAAARPNALTAFRPRVPGGRYAGPDASGVFSAEIWARSSPISGTWTKKATESTFFPATWTTEEVLRVVDTAVVTGRRVSQDTENHTELWQADVADPHAPTQRTVTVATVRSAANGELISAYPIQRRPTPLAPEIASTSGLLTDWKVPSGSATPTADDRENRDPAASGLARIFSAGPVRQVNGTYATEGLSTKSFPQVQLHPAGTADPTPAAHPGKTVVYRPESGPAPGAWKDDQTPYRAAVWSRQPTDRAWLRSNGLRSMFPDSWKQPDVVAKVNDAFAHGSVEGSTRKWRDPVTGVTIIVEVENGKIADAYPEI